MKKLLLSVLGLAAIGMTANARTIDDVAGYYTETCSMSADGYYLYAIDNQVDTVSVSKVDETTVAFVGLLGSNEEIQGIVDLESNTIIVAPQIIFTYYTFSASTDAKDPVIITIAEDGSLSFSDAMMTYYGYQYGWNATSTMVRYADNNQTTLFTVPCQIYVVDSDEQVIYDGMSTLTKYSEGQYPYVVADYCGTGASMKFYVDEDGQMVTNGSLYSGWHYFWYPCWLGMNNDYVCFDASQSEIEDNGAEGGYAVTYGCYYEDYDNWSNTCHYIYYYVNWGDYIVTGIEDVKAEVKNANAYLLDGRRADKNMKGLIVREGKTVFVK